MSKENRFALIAHDGKKAEMVGFLKELLVRGLETQMAPSGQLTE